MAGSSDIKRWLSVHRWSSLACTLFLLEACFTGLPLIFEDELTRAPQTPESDNKSALPALSIDELAVRAVQATPAAPFVQFAFFDEDHPDAVGFGLASTSSAALQDVQRVLFDKHSGAQISDTQGQSPLLDTLREVHTDLLLGATGDIVLGVVALCFVTSLISGAVVYGPFMRRLDFGAIRNTSARTRWLDLHNLIGIATLGWAVVVSLTGLMNTLEGPLFSAWQAQSLPALLSAHEHEAPASGMASLATAVDAATRALPGMQVTSIGLAHTGYGTARHHLVWLHGMTTLERRLFATALVDATNGQVVQAQSLPWYLRALEISRPLHFGDYGGLPLKLLWAALDLLTIAVLSSGLYLWWVRGQGASSMSVRVERAPSSVEPRSRGAVFALPAVLFVSTIGSLSGALLGEAAIVRWLAWAALAAILALIGQRIAVAARRARQR